MGCDGGWALDSYGCYAVGIMNYRMSTKISMIILMKIRSPIAASKCLNKIWSKRTAFSCPRTGDASKR